MPARFRKFLCSALAVTNGYDIAADVLARPPPHL